MPNRGVEKALAHRATRIAAKLHKFYDGRKVAANAIMLAIAIQNLMGGKTNAATEAMQKISVFVDYRANPRTK